MNRATAIKLANLTNGNAHHTGGNIFSVRIDRPDGSIVEIGADGISEYANIDDCYDGKETNRIAIEIQDVEE